MAFDYKTLRTPVSSILDEFNTGVVTIRKTTEAVNPANPWDYTQSFSDTTVRAIVTGVSEEQVDGTSIVQGDKFVIISAADLNSEPNIGDEAIIDGINFKVIKSVSVPPAGDAVLFRVQIRGF